MTIDDLKKLVIDADIKWLELEKDCFGIEKFNWDYSTCLEVQKKIQLFVQKNRIYKFYIFTNHPHIFTMGRGNERGNNELISFEPGQFNMAFPLHHIHRGGGITFHYPGQWICYPILSLSEKQTLDDVMSWLLNSVKTTLLNHFDITNLLSQKKLMGIWKDKMKLASIGVGVDRFVTEHGLALNLIFDEKMFLEVKKINPCGMSPEVYTTVDKILGYTPENLLINFHHKFLNDHFLAKSNIS